MPMPAVTRQTRLTASFADLILEEKVHRRDAEVPEVKSQTVLRLFSAASYLRGERLPFLNRRFAFR